VKRFNLPIDKLAISALWFGGLDYVSELDCYYRLLYDDNNRVRGIVYSQDLFYGK
jgi:hypothetical protein